MEESRASGERLAAAVDRLSRSHEEFSRISRGETVTPAPEPDPELHAENARLSAEIREIRQQLEVSTAPPLMVMKKAHIASDHCT